MNIISQIHTRILEAVASEGALPEGLDTSGIEVELPRDPGHGDLTSNVALALAPKTDFTPRALAELLAAHLETDEHIAAVEAAGSGFLNIRLAPVVWRNLGRAILQAGQDFGRSELGQGRRVNVEFASANPTAPLHIGHIRGAVVGDALASLLAFTGHQVAREYYINDGGAQVDTLARSAYLRYLEAHGRPVAFAEGTIPGAYLIPFGAALKEKFGDRFLDQSEAVWLAEIRDFAIQAIMDLIRQDLAALGIQMDGFYSEKALAREGRIEAALGALRAKGLLYEEAPQEKAPKEWTQPPQTYFRSTLHGDEVDRPVKKSDGSWTYFAPDIAYHYDKLERGFDMLIDVFGVDHRGYVKRMKAAVSALSGGAVPLEIKLIHLAKLYQGGKPYAHEGQVGTFASLQTFTQEVGADIIRFSMLTRKSETPLELDVDQLRDQSYDNPVFCVQYAHVRATSVLRAAGVEDEADLSRLTNPIERAILAKLAVWPQVVASAALAREPHRIALYLIELATAFHRLWESAAGQADLRPLQDAQPETRQAKIALCKITAIVIATGLGILGVDPVEELH